MRAGGAGRAELWEGPEVTDEQAEIPLASSLVNSTQQMDYVCVYAVYEMRSALTHTGRDGVRRACSA